MSKLQSVLDLWEWLTARLRGAGEFVPRLVLRLIMGYEFWFAGQMKYHGENWFADIQDRFPFPFNHVPVDLSWTIATWFEIIGSIALMLGLGTRFFAFSLLVLTFVATAAVHWPDMITMWSDLAAGYSVTDEGHGNFKLPLLFSIMLLPLVFNGAGKLSLDHLIALKFNVDTTRTPVADAYSWALAGLVLGIPFLMLVPAIGFTLIALAVASAVFGRFARS